jgi:quinol monooxygenase YgiN
MDYPAEATFYVRLSLMNPRAGKEKLVAGLMDNLLQFFAEQPGYVRGYALVDGDPQGRVGRITMWKSEEEADHAANTQHVLTVRSEIMPLVEDDSHVERSYTALDPEMAKASN